ncbi:MAG: LAGLIDADG family homing endonuclease [Candidatus Bathyarchaeia archaeon]
MEDFSRLDQVLYVDLTSLYYSGKHILIAGGAGSGKTSTLLLLAKLLYDNNETIIWRDDSSLEFSSLAEEVPIKIFIPKNCQLNYSHPNIEFFEYDPTNIMTILNSLNNQKINAILFDLFCFNIDRFIKFWRDFFYALYKWKRTKMGSAISLITDELNDLCITPETLVLGCTAKPISECQLGENVLTHIGKFGKISALHTRPYNGVIYRIKPRYTNICSLLTPSHEVLIVDKKKVNCVNENDEVLPMAEWIPAHQVDPNSHFLIIPRFTQSHDVEYVDMRPYLWTKKKYPKETVEKALALSQEGLNEFQIAKKLNVPRPTVEWWIRYSPKEATPHTHRKVPNVLKLDADLMRLIGYYLAEGSVSWNGLHFAFHCNEHEYHEDVSKIIRKISFHHTKIFRGKQDLGVDIVVYSLPLANFMKQFGTKSKEKHLPEWVLKLPIEKQAELIKGFWRGDGSKSKNRFRMSTSSQTLAFQLSLILHRMGIVHGLYKRIRQGRGVDFEIEINSSKKFAEIIGEKSFHNKKLRHAQVAKDSIILGFQKNAELYRGIVCNIEVNPAPSYSLVNICVHNCPGSRRGYVPKQITLANNIFFSMKKFRKEKIRLVGSTHNFTDLHKPVRDSFNFYIIRKMRREAVPERFANYASLIEKLEINQGIVVDEFGNFNRMDFPLYVKPKNISVPFEGDVEELFAEKRSEKLAERYREKLGISGKLLLDHGIVKSYKELADLWGVAESAAWKIVHGQK